MTKNKYELRTIYFYLSEGCNLRCCHCWLDSKYETKQKKYPFLDLELFKSIIKQAKPLGLKNVKLTGGEPLLHPHISEILDILKEEKLSLNIETNGTLLTPELAKKIRACQAPYVAVSIDGADPKVHDKIRGVKGSLEKACQGIKNLVALGIKPEIIACIMDDNKNNLKEIVRLGESLGCGKVTFNILQPNSRGKNVYASGKALSIEECVRIGRWIDTELSEETNLAVHCNHPSAFKPLKKIFGSGCAIFNIIGVLGNGSYALCGIGQIVPELHFGDATKENLKDVWDNNRVLNDIREGIPNKLKGICKRCLMKKVCKGRCVAVNYSFYKDLFAPYWYCEEAYKKGLFPESRIGN